MMILARALHLVAHAAVVVASTSYRNVLADVPNKDEAELINFPETVAKPATENEDSGSCEDSFNDGSCSSPIPTTTAHLDDCGIWLAPSSLPGAGLGMFAGKDFNKGDLLQQSGDVVIPIVDIMMHQRGRGKFAFLWDEYTWNGDSLGLGHETIKECNAASPGFGSAANSFLDLVNVDEGDPKNTIPNGLHRAKDPGVGAFSTYHDRQSTAKVGIRKGQELFVNYGQHWFEQRIRLGPIPIRRGLNQSTIFYRKFKKTRDDNPQVKDVVFDDLWDEFVTHTVWNESRILGAFMNTKSEKEMLAKNMTLKQIRVKESLRTQEWLKDHGTCADHIREDVSTIRQAGRGAFATRALPRGAVVAALPLIHIMDKSVLEMYELADIKTKKRPYRRLAGYQILTNYCYGHLNSTILLCPYGPIVNLINHNQTRANVKLKWGDPERGNHVPEMLNKTIEEFKTVQTSSLAMDLIATRDIEPGEEIFLDYGDAWEEAWKNHVQNWSPEGAEGYISAFVMNQDNAAAAVRTEFEQMMNPYPGNVNIKCDANIWQGINQTLFLTTNEIKITNPDKFSWWSCEVLRHHDINGTTRYTVVVTRPEDKSKKKEAEKKQKEKHLKLKDIPRMGIRFTDRPYTSDMFLKEAFRHAIMIPDDMFPNQWMTFSPI